MKKLVFSMIVVLFLFSQIPPASAQVECNGTDVDAILNDEQFALCWPKNAEGDQVVGYRVFKASVSNEMGDLFLTFLTGQCGADLCETGPLIIAVPGTYYLKVVAYDDGAVRTFQRYNPDTQTMEDETFTMPAAQSMPSREVVLLVDEEGQVKPGKPSGCSVRRLF